MMDENGYIKLGGFSVARKLSSINAVPLSELQTVWRRAGRSLAFARAAARHSLPPDASHLQIKQQSRCCALAS